MRKRMTQQIGETDWEKSYRELRAEFDRYTKHVADQRIAACVEGVRTNCPIAAVRKLDINQYWIKTKPVSRKS